ncbi:MAG: DUF4286 family protein [Candidatus Eisenbacteria bacterium]
MVEAGVVYQITAIVRDDLRASYEAYMFDHHIPDVIATGAFVRAAIGRAIDGRYRIAYHATSRAALDHYLATDAPRLRQDFQAHFPTGVSLTREEWEILRVWDERP